MVKAAAERFGVSSEAVRLWLKNGIPADQDWHQRHQAAGIEDLRPAVQQSTCARVLGLVERLRRNSPRGNGPFDSARREEARKSARRKYRALVARNRPAWGRRNKKGCQGLVASFTKLFSSITESTVWGESHATRIVWITMLAMADRMGRVQASVPGLANRARVTLEECENTLGRFMSPDKYSRTPDNDGRRVEPMDGGWRLLNYAKYREMRDHESRLEYQREWDRANRSKSDKSDQIRPRPTKAEAEAEKTKATTLAPSASRSTPMNGHRIGFDKGAFQGITEADELRWQEAYPAVIIPQEIKAAAAWLAANPANRKRNNERFLVNWFKRTQDRAPRVRR